MSKDKGKTTKALIPPEKRKERGKICLILTYDIINYSDNSL